MVDIVQTDKGDMELAGINARGTGFVNAHVNYFVNAGNNYVMFVADRAYRVKAINARVHAAGTDVGTVTGTVYKAPSGTALASGTALHSGTFNLKGTAGANQSLTLSTTSSDLDIAAGDAIGMVITGTATSSFGGITVAMTPR